MNQRNELAGHPKASRDRWRGEHHLVVTEEQHGQAK